jgi:hypothetical protein
MRSKFCDEQMRLKRRKPNDYEVVSQDNVIRPVRIE